MKNSLNKAKVVKNDEFYTLYETIETEIELYKHLLIDKKIYCNTDNKHSNFIKYFKENFDKLKIKSITATGHNPFGTGYYFYKDKNQETEKELIFNGSYDSYECVDILKDSDIIITNPPFSTLLNFLDFIIKNKKDYILIAPSLSLQYNFIFDLIKSKKLFTSNFVKSFLNNNKIKKVHCIFVSSFNIHFPKKELFLKKSFYGNPNFYKKYFNFDCINVDKLSEIPYDYNDIMGVPATILYNYNLENIELINMLQASKGLEAGVKKPLLEHQIQVKNRDKSGICNGDVYFVENGVVIFPFTRILIKFKL